jgi:hypothetical protein
MKKLLILLAILSTGLIANAQTQEKAPKLKPEARAAKMTDKMSSVILLSADQKAKVNDINLNRAKAMDLNREKAGSNTAVYNGEKERIIQKWNNELKAVLSAEQIQKLKDYAASQKQNSNQLED